MSELDRIKAVALKKLRCKRAVTADGTLNNLRKERDKKRNLCRALFGCKLSSVNVNDIARCLQGVKGDAERQSQIYLRCGGFHTKKVQNGKRLLRKEVEILQKNKKAEADNKTERKNKALFVLNREPVLLFFITRKLGMRV